MSVMECIDRDREEGELQVYECAGFESPDAVPVLHHQECIPVFWLDLKPFFCCEKNMFYRFMNDGNNDE